MAETGRKMKKGRDLKIVRFKGQKILPYISDLAKLRIEVFKSYPYLYLGDLQYETDYLQTYVKSPESVLVLVFDKDKVVGVSTAIPLQFESKEFQQPFLEKGINIQDVFYFGESVLLPAYRGKKIYRHFFQEREAAAKEFGCKMAAFCAVSRPENDPRKPREYTPLDDVWKHFGYDKHEELCAYLEWQEIGEERPSVKPLIFWLKNL
jgi:GNAT superfamily N-acetyltransferase